MKGRSVIVQTPMSQIRADKVILASNAFTCGKRKISSRVVAIRDRIIVSEPLTSDQLKALKWDNRQGVRNTRTQLTYMRLTHDNRILLGGRIGYFHNNGTEANHDQRSDVYTGLVECLYETFPVLVGKPISHAWSGPIALTKRMTAFYQPFHEGNMLYAGGYSGFGVAASRFIAKVGLAIIDNIDIPERKLSFVQSRPGWIPHEPLRWIGTKLTVIALNSDDKKGR